MIEAYNEGLIELKKGDVLYTAKKFNEAEILFPQSEVAPRAALMAAYSYYSQIIMAMQLQSWKILQVYPNKRYSIC